MSIVQAGPVLAVICALGALSTANGSKVGSNKFLQQSRKPLQIYVYDIPKEKDGIVWRADFFECEGHGLSGKKYEDCIWGAPVNLKLFDKAKSDVPLRDCANDRLATQALAALSEHPHRTRDPHQASVFYIPLERNMYIKNQRPCPNPEEMVASLPYLTEENAHLHFMIHGEPGSAPQEFCSSFWSQPDSPSAAARLLSKVKKFALEDKVSGMWQPSWAIQRTGPWVSNLVSWPYPSITNGLSRDEFNELQNQVHAKDAERSTLILAMFGVHGQAGTQQRMSLQQQCEGHSSICFHSDVNHGFNLAWMAEKKADSVFCLEPVGDSVSRKSIVDDIVLGCIPVLCEPVQETLWTTLVPNWKDVAVTGLDPNGDIMTKLAAIPKEEIEKKRKALAALAPKFTWSKIGEERPDDGLSLLLQAVVGV